MDPNFDHFRDRFQRTPAGRNFKSFRSRLYRSSHGKLLGVFSGLAESLGYKCGVTRWVGVVTLLFIATSAGAHGLKVMVLVAGFFYLLIALLMQPPRTMAGGPGAMPDDSVADAGIPTQRGARPGAVPYRDARVNGLRPDFAQLDRQLDNLSRRIQRMETIVTDRQYDWDRRMRS